VRRTVVLADSFKTSCRIRLQVRYDRDNIPSERRRGRWWCPVKSTVVLVDYFKHIFKVKIPDGDIIRWERRRGRRGGRWW